MTLNTTVVFILISIGFSAYADNTLCQALFIHPDHRVKVFAVGDLHYDIPAGSELHGFAFQDYKDLITVTDSLNSNNSRIIAVQRVKTEEETLALIVVDKKAHSDLIRLLRESEIEFTDEYIPESRYKELDLNDFEAFSHTDLVPAEALSSVDQPITVVVPERVRFPQAFPKTLKQGRKQKYQVTFASDEFQAEIFAEFKKQDILVLKVLSQNPLVLETEMRVTDAALLLPKFPGFQEAKPINKKR